MGEYSKAAIIKYTRTAAGMTQEELAEGICEPGTLSRYETGQLNPSDENFVRLMQKMGERGDTFVFPIHSEAADLQKEMDRLLYAIEKTDWSEVEKVKDRMETEFCLSREYPENHQYLKRIEVIIRYKRGEIGIQEAIGEITAAFQETFGSCEPEEFPVGRVLRETEILVVYNLASYYEAAQNTEKALAIYKRLDAYFGRWDMVNDYKPRYLVYVGYSNLLGVDGRHDESIEICKREIELLWRRGKLNYLYNFYYNIGWNIKKKIEKGLEERKRIPEAKCYVWMAYQLCKGYPENKKNLNRIAEFYKSMD